MQPGSPESDPRQTPPARVAIDALRALIEPVAAAHGVEIYDIEWTGSLLRVVIERPYDDSAPAETTEGGIGIDDCVNVSRDLSTALDVADLIPHGYNLEVSSPGLDRPLKRPVDFRRSVGKLAKCKLRSPASDGQMVLRGIILAADDESIRIDVDGNGHDVRLADIREARLVFADEASKPRKTKKKKTKGARSR